MLGFTGGASTVAVAICVATREHRTAVTAAEAAIAFAVHFVVSVRQLRWRQHKGTAVTSGKGWVSHKNVITESFAGSLHCLGQ